MVNRNIIGLVLGGLGYLLLQALLLQNVVLFDKAFCFLYVITLLFIPLEASAILLMGAGFVLGFTLDLFYNTLGIHASACVFMMYLRPYWVSMITPSGGYDPANMPTLKNMGLQWFTTYAMPLILLHHLMLFFAAAGGFTLFWFTLVKVILSTILTFLVVVLVQYLFYKRKRGL